MITVGISKFKAQALRMLDQVDKTHEELIITKRGRPLAKIIPIKEKSSKSTPGKLADTLVFEKDVVSPLGEEIWNSCK